MSCGEKPVRYELLEAPKSLLQLSQGGLQPDGFSIGCHGDGWGIAWRKGGNMVWEKRGRPAYEDNLFKELAENIRTDLMVAHIRLATNKDSVSDENSHPFVKGNLLLAHNGTIWDLNKQAKRMKVSDSKLLLDWIYSNKKGDDQESIVEVLFSACSAFKEYTSLTLLLSDGKRLYAMRRVKNKDKMRYYTLYVDYSPQKVVVSSEPLYEGERGRWREIADRELLIFSKEESIGLRELRC